MTKLTLVFLLITTKLFAMDYEQFADDSFRKFDNSLTIQIIPTSYPLVWEKPRELIWSLIKNEYWFPVTKSSLGHVAAEINCSIEGEKKRFFLGQSAKDLHGFRNYLIQGYGFSILNRPQNNYEYPFLTIDGKLDEPIESSQKYTRLIKKDHISFLSFKLNSNACSDVMNFMQEYELKTRSTPMAGNRYGFGADPTKFEGAGCAPFVQTLFHLAGLDYFVEKMDRTVYIPEELIGNPKKNKKVSFWKLFNQDFNMSIQNDKYVKFSFPDPQMLYDFVHLEPKRRGNFLPIIENRVISGDKTRYMLLDATNLSVVNK